MKKIIIGITGASGSILAQYLITGLSEYPVACHCVLTGNGERVFEYETGLSFDNYLKSLGETNSTIIKHDNDNLFAPIASGSYGFDAMVIIPCSMGSLAKIAHGYADSLLLRAADVCIKEKLQLIVIPRETPLSAIHLRNMLTLSDAGVTIMPPMPAYYQHPTTLSDITWLTVGRIMEKIGISNDYHQTWQGAK
ncbi:UbiX family flavin prenyltransferase [Fusibacter paucivorans]|uniref:Flavin prenyltransferase UbiX n=1 Tax=Fusibacter paucivorans TaxID=76009 RepID=A0ABS5PQ28_9FIRM|nr:UbiX family flavin prenyltransferase [Fusibacter paucivorans]MBS7526504.1 UbiX family flavin prenyltransferase [Fusibacter paucivorans]